MAQYLREPSYAKPRREEAEHYASGGGMPGLKAVQEFNNQPGSGSAQSATYGNTPPPAPGPDYLGMAGLGVQGVGMGANIIMQGEQNKIAREAAKAAEKRYQQELLRLEQLDKERRHQQELANTFEAGNYAKGYEDQAQKYYGKYS